MEIHVHRLLDEDFEYIQSSYGALPIRDFVTQIVRRITMVLPLLEKSRILGFAESAWQSKLASTICMLEEIVSAPVLRHLNTLDLQLEVFSHKDSRCLSNLVKVTERNVNLKVLRIQSGPNVSRNFLKSSENWAPLLR